MVNSVMSLVEKGLKISLRVSFILLQEGIIGARSGTVSSLDNTILIFITVEQQNNPQPRLVTTLTRHNITK